MTASSDPIVICAAKRTPLGAFMGGLSPLKAPELGAAAIRCAVVASGIAPERVSEVLMGNVLGAGQGQAPARQAARGAELPDHVGATTVNKVCGSGMRAIMTGCDLLALHRADVVVAGGMESMSNAPFLLPDMRRGRKAGAGTVLDHMMHDGLEDAYDAGRPMGSFGEAAVEKYGFTRAEQDEFAVETLMRAQAAQATGAFDAEIITLAVPTRKGEATIKQDEKPGMVDPAKISKLRPAFQIDGTITAASASANADGAAALVLTRQSVAKAEGLPVIAIITAQASHAQDPAWYTTAPIPAIQVLLERAGWQAGDVDVWEINEAFAVVAMAAAKDIGIPRDKLNVNGGACALGHPIGATGARLVVTLCHALASRGLKRGVAALCIGGGEATALAIELNS
ncbi:MAG: acetyl-CoA acetyltransferase [Roseobacter sp. MedPE-SWchi]|nr:MAG: acetyl-CoA acetyltransferase [Roseobacter sp. MedPE-SWchi]